MQLLLWASLLVLLVPGSESTTCWVQNSILNTFTQVCPANIYQCVKFDCKLTNPKKFKQTTKGCNDPANPVVACTTLMTNCQAQGGTGQCYTCTGDYCNSAPTAFTALVAVLVPMVSRFILL